MDSMITAAARALAAGDLLGVLKRVGLREDAPALALRGIAMAQLGDYERAKVLLRRAARAFGPAEAVAHARCVVAHAEVALALRDVSAAERGLPEAVALLERRGDAANAAFARLVQVRRLILLGEVERHEALHVKALNRYGKPVKLKVDGWMARIFQHEIDHLNGVLFTDLATRVWKPTAEEEIPLD